MQKVTVTITSFGSFLKNGQLEGFTFHSPPGFYKNSIKLFVSFIFLIGMIHSGTVQAQDEYSVASAGFIIVDNCSVEDAYGSLIRFTSLCRHFRIKEDADVNATDEDKNTPLHYAAKWGKEETAIRLINNGADVNAINIFGETPLDLALKHDNFDIAYLLEEGFLDKARIWLEEAI